MAYICRDDQYGPADEYESVDDFMDMCEDCFGVAPELVSGDVIRDVDPDDYYEWRDGSPVLVLEYVP